MPEASGGKSSGTFGKNMSPSELRDYLRLHDSGDDVENPHDFDYRAAVQSVEGLKSACEAVLGHPVVVNTGFQDSSKLASILSGLKPASLSILEFSKFGKMFTIRPNSCDATQTNVLADEIVSRGFTFISWDILREPYDGNIEWAEDWRWHNRFFDYL